MPEAFCLILSTTGSLEEAQAIAGLLVTRRLAACVQITPVSSVYTWQGALQKESEHLLLIKTTASRYAEVEAAIQQNHSYELPEVVQLPVERGLRGYLGWISENTAGA